MLTSIVAALVVLGILILVHEAGHFAMAKLLGVRVLRFSIGFYRIWGVRYGETQYEIGAFPLGGFNRMLGEEVGEEPKSEELGTYVSEIGHDLVEAARSHGTAISGDRFEQQVENLAGRIIADDSTTLPAESSGAPAASLSSGARAIVGRDLKPEENALVSRIRTSGSFETAVSALRDNPPDAILAAFRACAFPTQRLWRRIAIVLAGPFANIIFAPLLLCVVLMYGVPILQPVIGPIKEGLPAATSGLRTNDRVLSVDGHATNTWFEFADLVKKSDGTPLKLQVERGQPGALERVTIFITPKQEEEKNLFGVDTRQWVIGVLPAGNEIIKRQDPYHATIAAVTASVSMTGQLVYGIGQIISGATPARQALGGPIMIAQIAGREVHQGFASIATFVVMLSLELGLINLVPIPFLDGGHLLFFAWEGVRGKPLALKYREMALQVGLFLLVVLMAFVIFNDIARIVQG